MPQKPESERGNRGNRGFPKYTCAARQGNAGVNIVAKIVTDDFGWIFKRNHEEYDFGIDGQIEIVTDDGSVTGQMFAVQIKHGTSFLKERNNWGIVYRGQLKHFNYLANYPIPVVIIICDPKTRDAYWARFRPEDTQATGNGWKLTVPFVNRFSLSKDQLSSLVDPTADHLAMLQSYWKTNDLIAETDAFLYILDQRDVAATDVIRHRAFFDRLRKTRELALQSQGKVTIIFSGYDDDPREVFEINGLQQFIAQLDKVLPDLFFFSDTQLGTLKVFAACACDASWEPEPCSPVRPAKVHVDPQLFSQFLETHWHGLNEITHWLGMPMEENKRISYAVMEALGIDVSKLD